MQTVNRVINMIKFRAQMSRQFKTFLEESEAEYGSLVFFTDVRWLSKGKALKRFFFSTQGDT